MKISKSARTYLWFLRWFDSLPEKPEFLSRFFGRLKSLWQAFWLGILDTDELNGITWTYYMGKSGFEEEDFNIHQGLWSWETDTVCSYLKDCVQVLVAGAGGGREVIALSRLGYVVTAFDFSPYLATACRQNIEKAGCSAIVLDAPPDGLPEGLGLYDGVLIGRGFYHHIPGRMRRVAFLGACRERLKIGAPVILLDFFTRDTHSRLHGYTQTIANFLRNVHGSNERIELGDWLSNCMQHAFTREEIEQEFSDAGIKLEKYEISPFSEESHLAHAVGCTT